jgi:hypothetical protein
MRRPRLAVALGIAMAALPAAAGQLGAQIVRGTVGASGGGAAPRGAVIQLLDTGSTERAHALSREDGTFVLRASAPGRYRLVARDIGYRPTTTAWFDLRGDTTVTITLARLSTLLPQVKTLAQNPCDVRPDTGSAVWILWDQTITALLGASIALGDRDEQFKFVLSSRDYDLHPVELDAVEFATTVLRGDRPWASLEPDTLALRGYVFATDSGTMYYAPELDALLSRSFANSHCFSIHKQKGGSAKLVGVDFTPAPGIRHADIEGTFWLDAASRELRSLEFTYANLRFTKGDTLAGGRVQFLRLATGEWIIPDWLIRAPIASRATGMNDVLTRLRTVNQPSMRLYAPTKIRVKRGNLMEVLPAGTEGARPIWTRSPGTLRVRVTSAAGSRADAPLAGAVVRLPESTSQAVTDSTGAGQIDGLVGGEYFVEVTTPWYEALLRAPERLVVTMANGEHAERQVRVASVDQVVQSLCGNKISPFMGILSGSVTRDGVPEPDAVVTVDYNGSNTPGENSSIKTGASGTFRFCRVPPNLPLHVKAVTRDGRVLEARTAIAPGERYATIELATKARVPR